MPFVKKLTAVTICPGPNIVNFTDIVSLQTMVDHIYGRVNIMKVPQRPHMFIAELELYVNYLKTQLESDKDKIQNPKTRKYYLTFSQNLLGGINYYRNTTCIGSDEPYFRQALQTAEAIIEEICEQYDLEEAVVA